MTMNVETRVTIDAPLSAVWEALTDFEAFPEWCPALSFRGRPREGSSTPMTLRILGHELTVPVLFEAIDAERQLRWTGGPPGLFHGTHYFTLRPAGGTATEVSHGELFRGLAVPLLRLLPGSELESFYQSINDALKARCEGLP